MTFSSPGEAEFRSMLRLPFTAIGGPDKASIGNADSNKPALPPI
jgi:hypothetical protein